MIEDRKGITFTVVFATRRLVTEKGIVTQYDYPVIPANLHDQRIREQADGEMYNTIVYGLRSMPAYGYQIDTEDVWSIVHYVRALQRSQNATFEDLPEEERNKLGDNS